MHIQKYTSKNTDSEDRNNAKGCMILDAKVPHAISREKLRENRPQATQHSSIGFKKPKK